MSDEPIDPKKDEPQSFEIGEREKRLLSELFDWTERSEKMNYVIE